jgi:hypothetical protein
MVGVMVSFRLESECKKNHILKIKITEDKSKFVE